MTDHTLPLLGAALRISELADHADWLITHQRDVEIQDTASPDVLDGDWQPLLRQARDVLDGHTGRLGIHGPFTNLTIMARDPKIRAVVQERFRQALEFGGELGASHMVVHSPFEFFGGPFLPHSAGHGLADQIEIVHETLDDVLPLAQKIGCTLVVECIFDKNPASIRALVESFNSESIRMSIDVGHAFIKHLEGGPTPDGWVHAAGLLLAHLHLQDTDGQADRHWLPGQGAINWFALFQALRTLDVGQTPRLIIEVRDKARIQRGAEWLASQGLAR